MTPPADTQPVVDTDRTTVSRMFIDFKKDYEGRKSSGNEMAVIRLIGSTASLFKNFSNVWLSLMFNILLLKRTTITTITVKAKIWRKRILALTYLLKYCANKF